VKIALMRSKPGGLPGVCRGTRFATKPVGNISRNPAQRGSQMRKIKVNGKAIVDDIKVRASLISLMEKHGLSYSSLLKTRDILLEKGLVTREELEYLHLADTPRRTTVPAKEFLASFRSRPDDFHLMDRFGLTRKDLRRIYERLIQAGLLSEYEYYCRDKKAPEPEEPHTNASEDSTEVTLLRSVLDGGGGVDRVEAKAPPSGLSAREARAEEAPATTRSKRPLGRALTSGAGMIEETTLAICPNCGCPSDESSPDACVCCGIVFSKIKRIPANKRTPLWQFDYGIR
jgi:hypothetical protein